MPKIQKTGFTLLEVLLAVGLGVIVLTLALLSYQMFLRLTNQENREIELVQNGRVALDRLTRDLRQAEEIITLLPEVPDDPDNPPTNEIIFQDGHELEPISYLRYYLVDHELHREVSHYYFAADPEEWVLSYSVGELGELPEQAVDDDQIIAEYLDNLEFWGTDRLVAINLRLASETLHTDLFTQVCGRNLQ